MIPSMIAAGIFTALSYLVQHAFWSVVAGVLIVIAFVALLLLLVRGFYPKSTFSPASMVTAGILTVLLWFQFVPLCAAIGLKWKAADFKEWLDESVIHPEQYAVPREVLPEESREIVEKAVEEYPIMGMLFSSGLFEGFDTSNLAQGMYDELNRELNRMILNRLLISLALTAVGALIIIKLQDRQARARSHARQARRTSRPGSGSGRTRRPGPRTGSRR